MFEQDVAGLIKALRANKNDEASVIHQALEECRKEIKSTDIEVKASAVLKLVYLEMLGCSISFASFAIVECMSSPKYHIKAAGYLAASQCFDKETEVAVLVVNLVKKDLLSPPMPTFSSSPSSLTVAHLMSTLSAVSLLLTPSLARDLAPELTTMLTHSRPQVRKQTILTMWKVYRSWPGVAELSLGRELDAGDDPWIERLRERLTDDDFGVVSATVNLLCELARKDPKTYLPLAPELFGLLTASTNNWMLIKIIKLFAVLTPEEPRLVKKLVPPITELIETTPAMSLLYECIQTSIVGGMLNGREGEALAATCVDKLKAFLEDVDQNLRYIALVALCKILPTHPHLVSIHHDTIMNCIDDPDMSIRMRALDLVEGMVDRTTLQPVVQKLMTHLRPSVTTTDAATALRSQAQHPAQPAIPTGVILSNAYRVSLVSLILRMCSHATYANIANFEWYLDTLVELSYISLSLSNEDNDDKPVGLALRDQLIDVTARVKAIRPSGVRKLANLLGDEAFLENGEGPEVSEVLGAAAWICGEYCRELQDSRPVIASLFGFSSITSLPPHVLSLYIHNGVKIYAFWLEALANSWDESHLDQIRSVTAALERKLRLCASSSDVELQERGAELVQLLELVLGGLDAPRTLAPEPSRPVSTLNDFAGTGTSNEENDLEEINGFASSSSSPSNRRLPPTCLSLLAPMFFSHELNPVNPKAQSMVVLPEGLDLDSILVGVPVSGSLKSIELELDEKEEVEVEVDDFGRPVRSRALALPSSSSSGRGKKKSKKGKVKVVGVTGKKKRATVDGDPEEIARLRAERLERERDDPYYIGSRRAPNTLSYHDNDNDNNDDDYNEDEDEDEDDVDDIDSIPIVQLNLQDLTGRMSSQPTPPTPPPVVVDVDGELPEGVELHLPSSSSTISKLNNNNNNKAEERKEEGEDGLLNEKELDQQEQDLAAKESVVTKVVKKKTKKKDKEKEKEKERGSKTKKAKPKTEADLETAL